MPLPRLSGKPLKVVLRASLGPHLAAASIPGRTILLDRSVLETCDFERILVHEIFHFVWVRLGNPLRRSWEDLLRAENGKGELGWSAEWRKAKLSRRDLEVRSRRWRHYVCESFCDTAAWLYSGLEQHEEFTLRQNARLVRKRWFREYLEQRAISI